jgi:hypothetical protein
VLLFLLLLVFLVDLLLEYAYVDFTDILGLYAGLSTIRITYFKFFNDVKLISSY